MYFILVGTACKRVTESDGNSSHWFITVAKDSIHQHHNRLPYVLDDDAASFFIFFPFLLLAFFSGHRDKEGWVS